LVDGDIVGGDKIIHGPSAEELVAVLGKMGVLQNAEAAGLQRRTIIKLAQRLRPDERLDLDQALTELEHAVGVALEVIARGERDTNDDALVRAVLGRVAEWIRNDDLDGGVRAIDQALAELEARHRRSQVALLEEGIKLDTLRRDAASVARRVEMIVAIDHPTDRPAWLPAFRAHYDDFWSDGDSKGVNFSFSVAIELARLMIATARDADESGNALNLLGTALSRLGERESGTARLREGVTALRAALQEWTCERMPLDWAMAQTNLGNALQRLGERESEPTLLEEAVAAFRLALEVRTRERAPLGWATRQDNLGSALTILGDRERGTARLEEAVTAFHWHCRNTPACGCLWIGRRPRITLAPPCKRSANVRTGRFGWRKR
jgi:tetratricopeptide (TPR) repeat protein